MTIKPHEWSLNKYFWTFMYIDENSCLTHGGIEVSVELITWMAINSHEWLLNKYFWTFMDIDGHSCLTRGGNDLCFLCFLFLIF